MLVPLSFFSIGFKELYDFDKDDGLHSGLIIAKKEIIETVKASGIAYNYKDLRKKKMDAPEIAKPSDLSNKEIPTPAGTATDEELEVATSQVEHDAEAAASYHFGKHGKRQLKSQLTGALRDELAPTRHVTTELLLALQESREFGEHRLVAAREVEHPARLVDERLAQPVEGVAAFRVAFEHVPRRTLELFQYQRIWREIWTDGRVSPDDALTMSAAILRDHLDVFVSYDKDL